MKLRRVVAALVAGTCATGAALVAVAGPAAANDEGPLIPGNIYFLANAGGFEANTAADVLTSGTTATRPWQSLAVDATCPAGSGVIQPLIRIPQAGVPVIDWEQVPFGPVSVLVDSSGRPYTGRGDFMGKPQALTYLASQPGNTATLPFLVACRDVDGNSIAYFETGLTLTGTTTANLTWSVPSHTYPSGGGTQAVATTTTLTAAASGADLVLTAAVAPAGAAGQVTFKEGTTVLGTTPVAAGSAAYTVSAPSAGTHAYTADFAPTDTAAYLASSGSLSLSLGIDSATGQLVLTVPEAPVVDGSLIFSVPFDTPVALTGSRSVDNSRVTAAGVFPTVTVTDTRRDALLTGWEVNAQASDFTGTSATVGAKYLGWTPGTPSMTPDAGSPLVAQAGPPVASFLDDASSAGLSTSSLLGRAQTPGRGVSTLAAGLALAIPGATSAGSYTSTVTVTLVGG
ncbi:Ig-like domain repeat protein [Cellulomonas humilata]|uniref:Ig-like domain repeat protein n=1 Tax=Cellulomonas humilata TaxID=144055 RepID=A0A7Y5ZZT6_9CELL|nr:Ig-like domain repeat protein [Cellulomonas humilata]NUU16548.1 Ig-like domain repeat protein [Cellulomonas humilata]